MSSRITAEDSGILMDLQNSPAKREKDTSHLSVAIDTSSFTLEHDTAHLFIHSRT
jgi:hypothetical protein